MDDEKLKALMIDVIDHHFCCNSSGKACEAGY